MFLLGPSAGILPYLLAILVSLVYYIEEEKTIIADILPQSTIENCIETNIIETECSVDELIASDAQPTLTFENQISCKLEIYPFKIPLSLFFSNGPLRAPPSYFI